MEKYLNPNFDFSIFDSLQSIDSFNKKIELYKILKENNIDYLSKLEIDNDRDIRTVEMHDLGFNQRLLIIAKSS